jgi:hypothetical protein
MTLISRLTGTACAAVLIVAGAFPAAAAAPPKRRAVSPNPAPAGPTGQIVGTIKDATNGVPAEGARVTYAGQTITAANNGVFVLTVPVGTPIGISIDHPAFQPFTQTITAQAGGRYDFALTEKPSVTIHLKSGAVHAVDIGTAQFAYAPTFGSAVRSDDANLCRANGDSFTPNKTAFARILGPVTSSTVAPCCEFGPVTGANVEMKSGEKTTVYFKDTCSGAVAALVGRLKATGAFQYFSLTDVDEIDFP